MSRLNPPIKTLSYQRARASLRGQNGIIALCRPSSMSGRWITHITDAEHSHATMIGWPAPDVWGFAETRQGYGGRILPFSEEVRAWPGFYDLFEVISFPSGFDREYDGDAAWAFMCRAGGAKYGYRHLTRVWLRRRIGSIIPPIRNSNEPLWPRSCSALVHAAVRMAGGPTIAPYDCDVTPGDLSDPKYFRYLCTVAWDEDEADATIARGVSSPHTRG